MKQEKHKELAQYHDLAADDNAVDKLVDVDAKKVKLRVITTCSTVCTLTLCGS